MIGEAGGAAQGDVRNPDGRRSGRRGEGEGVEVEIGRVVVVAQYPRLAFPTPIDVAGNNENKQQKKTLYSAACVLEMYVH